ncbi:hypothetical protein KC19_10G084300 [Ceratodon purpureus]|uniref:Uncharacterized protein n=1 Tax=Ceratodon purpureus TaxID=3225 RepID=A0A8T0GIC0_CERPU|nr:hypothetical protein KC19_10G084300 [Ceratodon purpureus]
MHCHLTEALKNQPQILTNITCSLLYAWGGAEISSVRKLVSWFSLLQLATAMCWSENVPEKFSCFEMVANLGCRHRLVFHGRGIVGLLLLLQLSSLSVYSQPVKVISMQMYELYGLRLFWFAWNQSTPDPETNLAGWRTFDYRYYGNYGFTRHDDPCYGKQWRGLVCAQQRVNDTYYTAQIIGIVLQDVNI